MSARTELRHVSVQLAAAADDRIRRAVAMVDAMPVRGEADALIAPLRPRLARLRPARAVNFTRLLFVPLDPVIVPRAAWRPGGAGVPRPALAPLARTIRDHWPGLAATEAELDGVTTSDIAALLQIGARVWTEAVPLLLTAPVPPDWGATTGLDGDDHAALVRVVAIVLAQGAAVLRLSDHAADADRDDLPLGEICRASVAIQAEFARRERPERGADSTPLATMLAVLMLRTQRAGHVLGCIERLGDGETSSVLSAQTALDFVLDGMVRAAGAGTLAQAGVEIDGAAAMLADLDSFMAGRPAAGQHVQEARRTLDLVCQSRLDAAIAALGPHADGNPSEREELARDACALAVSAAQLGSRVVYDARLLVLARIQASWAETELPPASG